MALSRAVLPVIVLIAALALSACGGSSDSSTPAEPQTTETVPAATTTSPEQATTQTTTATTTTPPPAQPTKIIIRVVGGKPEDGIARPKVKKGERVVLIIESDTADEVHFHGYDISRDVAAGGTVRIPFVAKVQGRFEVELENSGVMLAELTVQ